MMHARAYTKSDEEGWDRFQRDCCSATFLHTRRFLSYHGDRFVDLSLIIEDDSGCIGLFPAAMLSSDTSCVVSHPGITYGGMLHQGALRGERMMDALKCVIDYYSKLGFSRLTYKAIPHIYHCSPAEDDLYALFRFGASRIRCDLSSTIDLSHRLPISNRRKRALKKALKSGVEVRVGDVYAPALWGVLSENLTRKHNILPVHTLIEIQLLAELFPENIQFIVGIFNGQVVAGVVLFITGLVSHTQYIAANQIGYDVSALDAVFDFCIAEAADQKSRYFDFGISNERHGLELNKGLHQFKTEFGAGGTVYEHFGIAMY
jgi:hypothetical protein